MGRLKLRTKISDGKKTYLHNSGQKKITWRVVEKSQDCFVAMLLAMTEKYSCVIASAAKQSQTLNIEFGVKPGMTLAMLFYVVSDCFFG